MIWGIAWYWYCVAAGLLIPWVVIYREIRDNFDDGFFFGLKIYLGISAVMIAVILVATYLLRLALGQ